MNTCVDYKPEEDNEYPLCKGCEKAKCNSCNLNANLDESKFDPNFCIIKIGV